MNEASAWILVLTLYKLTKTVLPSEQNLPQGALIAEENVTD
jgi:hypothetical protein